MRERRMRVIQLVCISAALVSAGCGYTTRSQIAERYATIYVTPFENKVDFTQETATHNKYRIYRPGLESEVTSTVTNKFLFDGNLRPAPEEEAALTLEGSLIEFRQDAVRYTDSDDVSEYRVNIVVAIELIDNKTGETVWQEPRFTGDATYFTTGPNAQSEGVAVNNAIDDLARRIVERCVEDW